MAIVSVSSVLAAALLLCVFALKFLFALLPRAKVRNLRAIL